MATYLKIAAAINAISALGHGQMGVKELFPALDKTPPTAMRAAAKIGWMEGCGYYVITALLCWKVAESGASKWDRYMLLVSAVQNVLCGAGFVRFSKPLPPLLPLWGTPTLLGLAYMQNAI